MVEKWYVWDGKGDYPDSSEVEAVMALGGRISRVDRRYDNESFRNSFLSVYWGRVK